MKKARLWATSGKSRIEILREFTAEFPVALLLKGSRTLVGQCGKPMAYNTTGRSRLGRRFDRSLCRFPRTKDVPSMTGDD